jgi:hypothetical protein
MAQKVRSTEKKLLVVFDTNAKSNQNVERIVADFLERVPTLEAQLSMPLVIFQDGVNSSYYVKCNILAREAAELFDLDAKINLTSAESFKSNRNLLLSSKTYEKMAEDAEKGREFNDIIVEYNTDHNSSRPLKVWGGQHRLHAIDDAKKTY